MSQLLPRAVLACVLAMAVTTACGSGSRSSAPPTSGPTTSVAPGGRADAGHGVTLEEAGAPPRKPLLLRISGGTTTSVALVAKIGLGMNLRGRDLPNVAVPATRVVMDQTVDKVDADGTSHTRVSITDLSVVPAPDVKQEVVDQTRRCSTNSRASPGQPPPTPTAVTRRCPSTRARSPTRR